MTITIRVALPVDESELVFWRNELCRVLNEVASRVAVYQADSTATDVAGVVADFNILLGKLRTAGLMETS